MCNGCFSELVAVARMLRKAHVIYDCTRILLNFFFRILLIVFTLQYTSLDVASSEKQLIREQKQILVQ